MAPAAEGLRTRLTAALSEVPLPAAVVDLDAFDHNLARMASLSGSGRVRVATKSVRCLSLLRRAADALGERFGGLMTVSPRESAWLAERGLTDLLVAYPVARKADALPLVQLARAGTPALQVVDDGSHLELLSALAAAHEVRLPVVIEVDAATRLLGQHLGVRRSPLRTAEEVLALVRRIEADPGLSFAGLMMYEAQLAGLADRPGDRTGALVRWVKRRARPDVRARRAAVVQALRAAGHEPPLVNGGGTGSVAFSAADPSLTEITLGSGLLAPHLFDGYDGLPLMPAAFAALPVTRRPSSGHVTVHGGGYPASGAIGPDRAPRVHAPAGLAPTSAEGFGEVQTPLTGATGLTPGELVLIRHAKAGELFERFGHVHLVKGAEVVEVACTWRGEGVDLG